MSVIFFKNSNQSIFTLFLATISFIFLLIRFILVDYRVRHVHISSAYYVTDTLRNGQTSKAVRFLALAENNIIDLDLFCDLDGRTVKTIVQHTGGPSQCKLATYLIDCPSDTKPSSILLMGKNSAKHQMALTEPDPKPRNLVVCFSRMFYFEKWQMAVAALEIYKQHNVDLLVIPISSVIEKLYQILQAYEKEGIVRLKEAVHLPTFADISYNPNKEVEWFHQITAYTQCLYDYRDSSNFILNVDMDDIIIPKYFTNLPKELNFLANQYPDAAAFEFLWTTTKARSSKLPRTYSIQNMLNDNYFSEFLDYGKSAIRPNRIKHAYIHYPSGQEVLSGFEHKTMTLNDSQAIHFRALIMDDSFIPKSNAYFANNTLYSKIDQNFHSFLNRHPLARNAFYELPNEFHYLKSMHDCYLDIGLRIGKNTLNYCPNPLRCTPEPNDKMPGCITLLTEFDQTQLSSTLILSTPISPSTFIPRVNCITYI